MAHICFQNKRTCVNTVNEFSTLAFVLNKGTVSFLTTYIDILIVFYRQITPVGMTSTVMGDQTKVKLYCFYKNQYFMLKRIYNPQL